MSKWRADLAACGRRATVGQALVAWIANPGFALACHYRLAHWAARRGRLGRGLALIVERRMVAGFGCHVSASARIGPGVRFPHPVAIVIGAGVEVGAGATIYQGVTLGRPRADVARYPRVGERVTIYCGATLLGAVTVDDGAQVATNRLIIEEARAAAGNGGRATMR